MDNQIKFDNLNPFIKAVMGGSQGSDQQLNLANVQFFPGPMDRALRDITRGAGSAIERGYGQLDKNVFGGLLPGGAESVVGKMKRSLGDIPVAQQTPQATPQAQPPATATPEPSTRLPGDQPLNTTSQLGGLVDVLRDEIEERGRRQDRITSPEYLDAAMRRRQQELAYATDLLSKAQMGQMREKTRRDVIDGWRKIQQEKIRANTVMATAMMNTAYLAATPNAKRF